jgi:hypothetical protein
MGDVERRRVVNESRDLVRVEEEERVRDRKVEKRGDITCLIEACGDAIVVVVGGAMEARDGGGDVDRFDKFRARSRVV